MSQRLGMADGRCTTVYDSTRLFNEDIYKKSGIGKFDGFGYRMFLQKSAPEDVIPAPSCSLFSYVKDFDIIESTNVISQNQDSD
jgi:hypothetical protein